MKYLLTFSSILILIATIQAQPRRTIYDDVLNKNRITLEDHDRNKSIFHITEYRKKAKDKNTYYWYTSRTIQQSQGAYSGKVLHGTFEQFYADKKLAQKGQFKNGLKGGEWRSWSTSGNLHKISTWTRSRETGPYTLYNEQGEPKEQGQYIDGQRDGKIRQYDPATGTQSYQYYQQGTAITREDYIQQNIFRRSGNYLSEKWKTWFSKKPNETQG